MIENQADSEFASKKYAHAYKTWEQVTGYFDGDGSVYLNTSSRYVLQFSP